MIDPHYITLMRAVVNARNSEERITAKANMEKFLAAYDRETAPPAPISLQVGKTYVSNAGQDVRILKRETSGDGGVLFIGDNAGRYSTAGVPFLRNGGRADEVHHSLVREAT